MMNEKKIKLLFGGTIKKLRKEQGLTQDKVSEKAGITEKRWSDIECGRYAVGLPSIFKIAEALDVHAGELLGFKETKEKKSSRKFFKRSVLKLEKQADKLKKDISYLKKTLD